MHHPSWLFPGSCNVRGRTIDQESSPNGNNAKVPPAGIEINSFVRSFNRNGIRFPTSFALKDSGVENDASFRGKERAGGCIGKSLNDFLSILSDSVDRVVDSDGCDRSNAWNAFASFRSSHEDRDNAAWNDLINLVSTTAHEFRDIKSAGNSESRPLDGKPATSVDNRRPELVEIYSDQRSPSRERVRRFEATKGLVDEILGATRNSSEASSTLWTRSIGSTILEDDFWPTGLRATSNNDFPPYFTGGFRTNIGKHSRFDPERRTFANFSRSSPIFVDAGEAIADEALATPTRDKAVILSGDESADARPIKLDRNIAYSNDSGAEDPTSCRSSENGSETSSIILEDEKKSLNESLKNVADLEETPGGTALSTKRGKKIGSGASGKNKRTKIFLDKQDEDNLSRAANSISPSPPTSDRRIPVQKFSGQSRRREEKSTTKLKKSGEKTDTRLSIASKIQRPARVNDSFVEKRTRTVAKPAPVPRQTKVVQFVSSDSPRRNVVKTIEPPQNGDAAAVATRMTANTDKSVATAVEAPTTENERPGTAKETWKSRIPGYIRSEVECQRETLHSANGRITRNETTIPVMRSKTFVHRAKVKPCVRRVVSREDYSRTVERASNFERSGQNNATCDPVKQIFRNPWKNSSRIRREVNLSSDTNLEDTTSESRTNTDTEVCSSVSAESDFKLKKCTDNTRLEWNRSVALSAEKNTVARSKFQNKHAKSLRMLKNILSNGGVDVENVTKEATEKRSRSLNDSAKKSRIPACTRKDSPRTSRTLFEKLAVLAETQPEGSDLADPDARDSSELSTSFANVASDSTVSCVRSMRDAADQCSIGYESSMVSRASIRSEESPREIGKNLATEYADRAVSPLTGLENVTKLESVKFFDTTETQTRSNTIDRDSITEEQYRPLTDASTETITIVRKSKEASTYCRTTVEKISRDVASGEDGSNAFSKEANTQSLGVSRKSRGVCFRGVRKIDGSCQVERCVESRNTASGRDYVQMEGVSRDVNTDRQDYLYVDRSLDALGPETTDDACQIEPRTRIIDVAVGDHSQDLPTMSILEIGPCASTNNCITGTPRRVDESPRSSSSSLLAFRGSSVEKISRPIDRIPHRAIVALEIARRRGINVYRAMQIYREKLAVESTENNGGEPEETDASNESRVSTLHSICKDSTLDSKVDSYDSSPSSPVIINEVRADSSANDTRFSSARANADTVIDDILKRVTQIIEKEHESIESGEGGDDSTTMERVSRTTKREETERESKIEETVEDEDEFISEAKGNVRFSLLSRNSLLTVVYGTVCSFVFWALQFSITCDSL